MVRMQYHFETPDDSAHHEMQTAAVEAARVARRHGLEPPTILVSDDENPRRLVIEFTGEDKWECDAKQQAGREIPELSDILGKVFRGRLTGVEIYEVLSLTE